MNDTVIEMLEQRIEEKKINLGYHQDEAKEFRAMVRQENARIKVLKKQIADMEDALDGFTD